jgi:N-acetylneuraminic acid mutarotase
MGQMNYARDQHTTTALSNGRVLIFGGIGPCDALLPNVELYDPIANSFIDLGGFPSRISSAAVLLANGKVLVTGGYDANGSGTYRGAVLYAPSYSGGNGAWFAAVSLANEARKDHTATLLRNGKVLLAGGINTTAAELYDPNATANAFSYTGNMINVRKTGHRATLLPNGEVLLTGGADALYVQATTEIYNPQTGTFRATTPMHYPRFYHSALLLPNGKVLVTGGDGLAAGILSQSEIYDPATETWTLIGSLNQARYNGAAVILPNGTPIFLAGTDSGHKPVASAEILIAPLMYAVPSVKK